MGRLAVTAALLAALLGGCGPRNDAAKPQTKPAASRPRRYDDFGLPLVIQIDAPEVPPEIQKPSAPIHDSSPGTTKPSAPIRDSSRVTPQPMPPIKKQPKQP